MSCELAGWAGDAREAPPALDRRRGSQRGVREYYTRTRKMTEGQGHTSTIAASHESPLPFVT